MNAAAVNIYAQVLVWTCVSTWQFFVQPFKNLTDSSRVAVRSSQWIGVGVCQFQTSSKPLASGLAVRVYSYSSRWLMGVLAWF